MLYKDYNNNSIHNHYGRLRIYTVLTNAFVNSAALNATVFIPFNYLLINFIVSTLVSNYIPQYLNVFLKDELKAWIYFTSFDG